MADKENNVAFEQKAYCKNPVLYGCTVTDVKNNFDKVYGTPALFYSSTLQWIYHFHSRQDSLEDDHLTERLLTAFTKNHVDAVRDLINQDARCTVEELAMCTRVNLLAVFTIFKTTFEAMQVLYKMGAQFADR